MSVIDINAIKKLREETGAGVMDVRKALMEAQGDYNKARELIIASGLLKAEKRLDRDAKAGIVYSYIHSTGKVGVLLELNCETDFVAKTDEFINLSKELALQIAAMPTETIDSLLAQPYIRDAQKNVGIVIKETVGKIGENITLRRFTRYELGEKL